jgi:hypothetical protein
MRILMNPQWTNPKAISEAGEKIYREQHQARLEAEHSGEFVAINVNTGRATVRNTPEEALLAAKEEDPSGVFHLIRIGFDSAFQVSHATEITHSDWLFG